MDLVTLCVLSLVIVVKGELVNFLAKRFELFTWHTPFPGYLLLFFFYTSSSLNMLRSNI